MNRRGKRRRAARGRDEDPTVFPGHDARDEPSAPHAGSYEGPAGHDPGRAGAHGPARDRLSWAPEAAAQQPWPSGSGPDPDERTAVWGRPADWTSGEWRAGEPELPGAGGYGSAYPGGQVPGHDPRYRVGDGEEYPQYPGATRPHGLSWDDAARTSGWGTSDDGASNDAGPSPLIPDRPDGDPEPQEGYRTDVDEHEEVETAKADKPPRRRRWRELRPDPPPMETNEVLVLTVGTVLWGLAFGVLLPFHGRLAETGHGWWVWTCLAGVGIGLLGIYYTRRRREKLGQTGRERSSDVQPELPPVPPAPGFHAPGHEETAVPGHDETAPDAGYGWTPGDAGERFPFPESGPPPVPRRDDQGPGTYREPGPDRFGGHPQDGEPEPPHHPQGGFGSGAPQSHGSPDLPPPPQAPWSAGAFGGWLTDRAPWDQTGQHGPLQHGPLFDPDRDRSGWGYGG
ncbi:DUF2530 domain-containing protein [Carbonactinospora thermoautotrophica]|uniref:DUF2530 domain-containing protein n=1 Tax=Carbonactinospora thermoautotrophica TaxID=1469144 RepID=UPI000AE681E6|nr:DUF2530 domain-containing protein [Carbonactinospora thermoautotrophica]